MKHIVSAVLVALAAIFTAVAFAGSNADIGWSAIPETTYSRTTTTRETSLTIEARYGLTSAKTKSTFKIVVNPGGSTTETKTDVNIKYADQADANDPNASSDACTSSFCDDCEAAGNTIISFLTFALIASIVGLIFIGMRAIEGDEKSFFKKLVSTLACVLTAVFLFICMWTWYGGCHEKIYDSLKDSDSALLNDAEKDLTVSTGFAMAVVGTAMAGFAAINEFCVA